MNINFKQVAISSIVFLIISQIINSITAVFTMAIPGEGISKGFNYGKLLFLIAGIPFTLTIYCKNNGV